MKTQKSTEIENNLNQTTLRLDELVTMQNGINTNLQTLQDGFVKGKTSLDEVQAEQARLDTLNSSIKALEAKQDELHTAFQMASLSESRQNLLESARTTALEAETLFNESLACRRELDNVIGKFAEKFVSVFERFEEKRREYIKLRGQFDPNQTPGLSNDVVLLLEKNHLNFPPVRFGLSVQAAYQVIEKERGKQELAKSQAVKARQMSSGIS